MAEDVSEDFQNIVNSGYLLLIFAGLGLVVYIVYEANKLGESVKTSFCTFFGGDPATCAASGSSTGNTYSNAATQTVTDPIGTLGSIIGLNQGDQANLPVDSLSAGGY